MKSITNLIIYLGIIFILVILCNSILQSNSKESQKEKNDEKFTIEKPRVLNDELYFDYESVPEEEEKLPIEQRYVQELNKGAFVHPQYSNDSFVDQKAIYNNDLYVKPIHTERTLDPFDDNDLPKTIAQVFEESITDFKKLTPLKVGQMGDFVVQGASEQSTFNPDFITYDDEKPENGGKYEKINLYGYDPLLNSDAAIF